MKIQIFLLAAALSLMSILTACASGMQTPVTALVDEPFEGKTDAISKYSFSPATSSLIPGDYCAPVCASSLLMWMGDNGFPTLTDRTDDVERDQFDLAMKLASVKYMDSSSGTTVNGLCSGLCNYILDRGIRYKFLEHWGWQYVDSRYDRAFLPDLNRARAVLRNKYGFAILAIGYYYYNSASDEYLRRSGHILPVTGYGYNGETVAPGFMTTFNAYHTSGMPAVNYIKPVELHGGLLKSPLVLAPCPADGFFEVSGLQLPEGSDHAIIDGIVILEMWP